MSTAVIFGGNGFIGSFFAAHLLEVEGYENVYLYDSESIRDKPCAFRRELNMHRTGIVEVIGDVRKSITWVPNQRIDLVANFAAVHREPGHDNSEYYECNLLGAENVCSWAERVGCNKIIFSSSIAPYGPSESPKNEMSVPTPETAYGGSKLVAEKIHMTWQVKDSKRQLLIVRPGVVFGPGEGGNVSRLVKAVNKRYFCYTGNRQTRKAGIYVKELCYAMMWVLESDKAQADRVSLVNMSMSPGPSIQEYVETIGKVAELKLLVPSLPSHILLFIAHVIDSVARPLRVQHPFSPVRLKKLVRSNNILPSYLLENGYPFKYSLREAFIDWRNDFPEEWN